MKLQKLLALCLGMLILAMGCNGERSNILIVPNVLDERQMQVAPTRPSEDTTGSEIESPQYLDTTTVIVAIGDSITYGQDSTMGGYPAMLQAQLLYDGYDAVVINAGIPGERAHATEDRFLETIAGADIVLIMIGTNDIVNPMACAEPFNCRTIEHIEALLDYALISQVVPVISTVPPANPDSLYSWANSYIQGLNAQIYAVAVERQVYLVDNYNAVMTYGGSYLFSDSLHFTDQGYEILAQQWYKTLVENELLKIDQQ